MSTGAESKREDLARAFAEALNAVDQATIDYKSAKERLDAADKCCADARYAFYSEVESMVRIHRKAPTT